MTHLLSSSLPCLASATDFTAFVHLLMLFNPWSSPLMLTTLALGIEIRISICVSLDQCPIAHHGTCYFLTSCSHFSWILSKQANPDQHPQDDCLLCFLSYYLILLQNDYSNTTLYTPATLILLSERLDAAAESTPCERLLLFLIWLLLAVHCN